MYRVLLVALATTILQADSLPVTVPHNCVESDVDFPGADIKMLKGLSDIHECANNCLKYVTGCVAVTYRKSDKHCWYKNKRRGDIVSTTAGVQSVSLDCFIDIIVPHNCVAEDVDFYGADIKMAIGITDLHECVTNCHKYVKGCKSVTYRDGDSKCWYKNKRRGDSVSTTAGVQSVTLDCFIGRLSLGLHWSADNTGDRVLNVQGDALDLRNPGFDNAMSRYKIDGHETWIFYDDNDFVGQACFADTGPIGWTHAPHSCNDRVGSVRMVMSLDTFNYCVEDNADYHGADIRWVDSIVLEECVTKCRMSYEGCKSVTFDLSRKKCYLKNKSRGDYVTAGQNLQSVSLRCVRALENCLEQDVNYHGGHIKRINGIADVGECLFKCRNEVGCKSVTFITNIQPTACFLKNKDRGDRVEYGGIRVGYQSATLQCVEGYYEPTDQRLEYYSTNVGSWGLMETCPKGGYAIAFNTRAQEAEDPQSMNNVDETGLNTICLVCNTGEKVCSRAGYKGGWHMQVRKSADICRTGYIGANFRSQQGSGDQHGATNLKLVCSDGREHLGVAGQLWGSWQGRKDCPIDHRICGLKTRVQSDQGRRTDNTALNAVQLLCCKIK